MCLYVALGFGFGVLGGWLCWWFAGCMLRLVLGISDLAVLCGWVFWLASGFALVVFGFSFGFVWLDLFSGRFGLRCFGWVLVWWLACV